MDHIGLKHILGIWLQIIVFYSHGQHLTICFDPTCNFCHQFIFLLLFTGRCGGDREIVFWGKQAVASPEEKHFVSTASELIKWKNFYCLFLGGRDFNSSWQSALNMWVTGMVQTFFLELWTGTSSSDENLIWYNTYTVYRVIFAQCYSRPFTHAK